MGYLEDLKTKLRYLEESGPPNAAAADQVRAEIAAAEPKPKKGTKPKT